MAEPASIHRERYRERGGRGAVVGGIVAAVLAPLLPAVLWGEGAWLRFAEDGRTVYLLERGGPDRSATGTVTVRVKRAFRKTHVERASSFDTLEVDCGRNLYRYTEIVIVDGDGDVMHRYRLTDQFVPVTPGSIPGRVRERVCAAP